MFARINFQFLLVLIMQPIKTRLLTKITSNFSVDQNALIGKGQFGSVYQGLKLDDRQEIAVKIILPQTLAQYGKQTQREIEILQKLKTCNHPNIVRYYGYFLNGGRVLYQFYQKCSTNLMEKLEDDRSLKEEIVKSYFRDIMAGLLEIHQQGIIHRDLKPQNILLSNGTLKLTDFGLSRQIRIEGSLKMTTKVGSYAFHAPETFLGDIYDQRSDVWSAGLILYLMLAGTFCREYPLNSEIDVDKRNQDIRQEKLNLNFQGKEAIWETLLRKMLVFDPTKRASSKEILSQFDAWITRPIFSVFKNEPIVPEQSLEINLSPEQQQSANHQGEQMSIEQQEALEKQLIASLKEEPKFSSLLKYLEFLDYYHDCKKFSELIQSQIIQLVKKNSQLKNKYPSFFILTSCFLAQTITTLRLEQILKQMTLPHHPSLSPQEQHQYSLFINIKLGKFRKFVNDYKSNFPGVTQKLIAYRQRKELSKFSQSFEKISKIAEDPHKVNYQKVIDIFDELLVLAGINLKPSPVALQQLSDSQVKIHFFLLMLRVFKYRFINNYLPMSTKEKIELKGDLEHLEASMARKRLSE